MMWVNLAIIRGPQFVCTMNIRGLHVHPGDVSIADFRCACSTRPPSDGIDIRNGIQAAKII
jgi:hypothetical protein